MSVQPEHNIPTTDSLGARLALVRWKMGWNLKEAALACGIKEQNWREWELHGRSPRDVVEAARIIATRTGVDDYWIMTGKKKTPGEPEGGSRPGWGGPNDGGLLPESNRRPSHYKWDTSALVVELFPAGVAA